MKKKLDIMIDDYINGESFDEDELEKLENNKKFMQAVIDKSNDYKLYNLCSNNLKKNTDFVKYLISKFSYNLDFICNVTDYYLKSNKKEDEQIEIVIMMCELTRFDSSRNFYYSLYAEACYQYERLRIEIVKNKEEDIKSEIGMGFYFIFDMYRNKKKVLNFYAERMVKSIFEEYEIDLEKMIHEHFKTAEEINEIGINSYLLEFIGLFDSMLSSYISAHINILANLKQEVLNIQRNWNKYNDYCEYEKYMEMFDRVHTYIINTDGLIDEISLIYYAGKKLGVIDKILKYDNLYNSNENIYFKYDEKNVEQLLEISFYDRIIFQRIKEIMYDALFNSNRDFKQSKIKRINFKK